MPIKQKNEHLTMCTQPNYHAACKWSSMTCNVFKIFVCKSIVDRNKPKFVAVISSEVTDTVASELLPSSLCQRT